MEIGVDQFAEHFKPLARQFHDTGDMEILLQSMSLDRVSAGTELIRYEGECSSVYLVWEGRLVASIEDESGKIVLGEIGPGDWTGEVTLIEPGPATASVTCIEDCVLLSMSHDKFRILREEHPATAGALMHAFALNLAERLRNYGNCAAHEVASNEYVLEPLHQEERESIITVIARLMGIRGK